MVHQVEIFSGKKTLVTSLYFNDYKLIKKAVVVAQLVERLLLIPEVPSLNPVISKNLY